MDKQTHFLIRPTASDSEIEVVLGMLARESSESVRLELGCGPLSNKALAGGADNLVSRRGKRAGQLDAPADVLEVNAFVSIDTRRRREMEEALASSIAAAQPQEEAKEI